MGLAGHLAAVIIASLVAGVKGCPRDCTCRWKSGKETVECAFKGLSAIPEGIASGTQVLDASGNPLLGLQSDAFLRVGLLNLQRIYLAHCNLRQVSERAFARLTNLVELDLGHNSLGAVPSKAFHECPALRRLVLSGNPITQLEGGVFSSLPFLTTLEMSRCQVHTVAPRAFEGLDSLTHLKLDGNQLTTLKGSAVVGLRMLHDAALHGNPWRCDCALREMRAWLVKSRVPFPVPPVCEQPPRVRGLALDRVDTADLACEPRGETALPVHVIAGYVAVLICRTSAIPEAQVQWVRSGKTLMNWTLIGDSRRYLVSENGTVDKTSRLVIPEVREEDADDYVCSSVNKAGTWRTTVTLHVAKPEAVVAMLDGIHVLALVAGILLLALVAAVVGLVVRRRLLATSRSSKDKDIGNHVGFSVDNGGQSKLIRRPLLAGCRTNVDGDGYAKSYLKNNFVVSRPDVVNVQTEETSTANEISPRLRLQEDKWPPSAECNSTNEDGTRKPTRYALLRTSSSADDSAVGLVESDYSQKKRFNTEHFTLEDSDIKDV